MHPQLRREQQHSRETKEHRLREPGVCKKTACRNFDVAVEHVYFGMSVYVPRTCDLVLILPQADYSPLVTDGLLFGVQWEIARLKGRSSKIVMGDLQLLRKSVTHKEQVQHLNTMINEDFDLHVSLYPDEFLAKVSSRPSCGTLSIRLTGAL